MVTREDEIRSLLLVFVTQLRIQVGVYNYTQMCLALPILDSHWRKTLGRFCGQEQLNLINSLRETVLALRKEQEDIRSR